MDKNILLLLEAIMDTNIYNKEAARKKGIAFYQFDLGRFLREKNSSFFSNPEYQNTFSQIPFEEIERSVKDSILKYTIGVLGRQRNLKIAIPDYLQKWIDNKDRSFHTVYEEIISNPYHAHYLLELIQHADEVYRNAKKDMLYHPQSPYFTDVIKKLENERQLLQEEITEERENGNYNVDALIEAYESTDQVFQSRGAQPGKIDLGLYLKEGNTGCFTRQNNVRSKIMAIPFEDMETDVKKALLEGAIAIFGTKFNPKEDFKNQIPDLFLDWINYNSSTIYQSKTFEDLYQEIISNGNLYPNLIQTLKASKDRYLLARDNYLSGDTLEPGTKEVISVLEDEKDNLFTSKTR